jgi:RNA polymerase sigma factor (sigma-70 family)
VAGGEATDAREARIAAAFRSHGDAVFGYASRRLDPLAAEEVVSDTFLAAWRRIDEIDDPLLPWLLGTAHKLIANELRRRSRRGRLIEQMSAATVACPPGPADDGGSDRVRLALASLPHKDQDVLIMSAWFELTAAEAARALGCTTATYNVRLHRARRRLRDALTAPAPPTVQLSRITKETT